MSEFVNPDSFYTDIEDGEMRRRQNAESITDPWEDRGETLVRKIRRPRDTFFSPIEATEDLPCDMQNLEAVRITKVTGHVDVRDCDSEARDHWSGDRDLCHKMHFKGWTGWVLFLYVRPPAPKGLYWCDYTRLSLSRGTSEKPRDMHPDDWSFKGNSG